MSTNKKEWGEGTKALHAGYSPVPMDMTLFRSFVPPIIESSAYPFESVAHGARVLQHKEPGFYYGRMNNPTVDILQKRLAMSSGMQGVFCLLNHLDKVGDEIVTSHMIYGEAYKLFFQLAPNRLGITRAHNVPLIVDNTLATPLSVATARVGGRHCIAFADKVRGGAGVYRGQSLLRMTVDPAGYCRLTGYVYVADFRTNTVTVIRDTKVITTFDVGWYPYGIGVNPANEWVYVSNSNDSTVTILGYRE